MFDKDIMKKTVIGIEVLFGFVDDSYSRRCSGQSHNGGAQVCVLLHYNIGRDIASIKLMMNELSIITQERKKFYSFFFLYKREKGP